MENSKNTHVHAITNVEKLTNRGKTGQYLKSKYQAQLHQNSPASLYSRVISITVSLTALSSSASPEIGAVGVLRGKVLDGWFVQTHPERPC